MPLSLHTKDEYLQLILDALLAGSQVTYVGPIGVARSIAEGAAANSAELDYSLYQLSRMRYIDTAAGEDLDTLTRDMGFERDTGQEASDIVTFTRVNTWIEDIALLARQVLQATLADGTTIAYRSIGDVALRPQGRSVSGQAPGTSLTSGINDQLRVNLDGDGVRTVTLGTQASGVAIASALQTAVRALTAITPGNQPAYAGFRCDYSIITPGALTLQSGSTGPTSTVVVTASTTNDATVRLKLGLAQGGIEHAGQDSVGVSVIADTVGVVGNVGVGQIQTQVSPVAGILSVANPLLFSNGRERASDDAHRQAFRIYLQSLGDLNRYAIERAVYTTLGSDGQRHVQQAQVVQGVGNLQVYICDGRSMTEGAQPDVLQDVQDELDGLGQKVGGWLPCVTAGVIPAMIRAVDLAPLILVGATADLLLAQQAATYALYAMLYQWPIGASLSVLQVDEQLHATIRDMLSVTYPVTPGEFTATPTRVIGGTIGEKLMPRLIAPVVQRA